LTSFTRTSSPRALHTSSCAHEEQINDLFQLSCPQPWTTSSSPLGTENNVNDSFIDQVVKTPCSSAIRIRIFDVQWNQDYDNLNTRPRTSLRTALLRDAPASTFWDQHNDDDDINDISTTSSCCSHEDLGVKPPARPSLLAKGPESHRQGTRSHQYSHMLASAIKRRHVSGESCLQHDSNIDQRIPRRMLDRA